MTRFASSTMAFFSSVTILTRLCSVSERAAKSYARGLARTCAFMTCRTSIYLCFSVLTVMVWNAYLIEQTMQLADDGVDLLGKVAGVHRDEMMGGSPSQ